MKTKITKHLLDKQKINLIKIGNINVKVEYSQDHKTINECMLNSIKRKLY